jgi:hypothetical protein
VVTFSIFCNGKALANFAAWRTGVVLPSILC